MILELPVVVALIIGLTEVIKRATGLESRYIPIVSLLLSLTFYVVFGDVPLKEELYMGVIAGLTSVGLFSGVKNTLS